MLRDLELREIKSSKDIGLDKIRLKSNGQRMSSMEKRSHSS